MFTLTPEIEALIDRDLYANRFAEYKQIVDSQERTRQAITTAETELAAARKEQTALATQAAMGRPVSPSQIAAAAGKVKAKQEKLDHLSSVLPELEAIRNASQERLSRATGDAHAALLEHSVGMRIAAAARRDKVLAELAKADAAYEDAISLTNYAMSKGARLPPHLCDQWGAGRAGNVLQSEARERALWRRA